jgi:hypothetical protein
VIAHPDGQLPAQQEELASQGPLRASTPIPRSAAA